MATKRTAQPNQANERFRRARDSALRSGASQYSLWGRLTRFTGIMEKMAGIPKVKNAEMATAPAKNAKKTDFDCQPLATPRASKWEATTSGSCEEFDQK